MTSMIKLIGISDDDAIRVETSFYNDKPMAEQHEAPLSDSDLRKRYE